jgi:hypothetical protein
MQSRALLRKAKYGTPIDAHRDRLHSIRSMNSEVEDEFEDGYNEDMPPHAKDEENGNEQKEETPSKLVTILEPISPLRNALD